jgi:two-component system LytT family response regulator
MFKVAIVEDEFIIRQSLKNKLAQYPQLNLVGEFDSIAGFEAWHPTEKADLLFLDITLPDGNMMEYIRNQYSGDAYVIFITAYADYAADAFNLEALDYIVKPIQEDRLILAIQKFLSLYKTDAEKTILETEPTDEIKLFQPGNEKLLLPVMEGYHLVPISDIVRCMAEINYTRLFLIGNAPLLSSYNLRQFEVSLTPFGFLRVHKSYLINVQHIRKVLRSHDGGNLLMTDGSEVPISRNLRGDMKTLLKKYFITLNAST